MNATQQAVYNAFQALSKVNELVLRRHLPHPDRLRYRVDLDELADGLGELPRPIRSGGRKFSANLISSLCTNGKHRPVLDLDRVGAVLVPSSTEGNFHLYLENVELTWRAYCRLLRALADAGIIEEGYLRWSLKRGQSTVRAPGVRKLPRELNRPSPYERDWAEVEKLGF